MPEQKLTNAEIKDRLLMMEVCDVFLYIVDGDLVSVRLHDIGGKDVFVFTVVNDGHPILSVSVADQVYEDDEET